jgi:hypothetical protein
LLFRIRDLTFGQQGYGGTNSKMLTPLPVE